MARAPSQRRRSHLGLRERAASRVHNSLAPGHILPHAPLHALPLHASRRPLRISPVPLRLRSGGFAPARLAAPIALSASARQVIFAIVSVVKTVTRKKAHRITTQVHTMGTATVTVSWKQQAKQYCLKLQQFGLTSSITPE